MHKKKLLHFREPEVRTILERRLTKEGYRICPKVRLQDAIGLDRGEHLPEQQFTYFTRSHLDFLVTSGDSPIFAVEFDGSVHTTDDKLLQRDAIKNALCKM